MERAGERPAPRRLEAAQNDTIPNKSNMQSDTEKHVEYFGNGNVTSSKSGGIQMHSAAEGGGG